jgi:hypothetical protein
MAPLNAIAVAHTGLPGTADNEWLVPKVFKAGTGNQGGTTKTFVPDVTEVFFYSMNSGGNHGSRQFNTNVRSGRN